MVAGDNNNAFTAAIRAWLDPLMPKVSEDWKYSTTARTR
jgi:hypothetical protein